MPTAKSRGQKRMIGFGRSLNALRRLLCRRMILLFVLGFDGSLFIFLSTYVNCYFLKNEC